MKCTKCGKNLANVHYKTNYNGNVTEMHLCDECAKEMGIECSFMDEMFSDFFGGFTPRGMFSPFGFGGFMMPTLVMPRLEIKYDRPEIQEKTQEKAEVNEELSKKRELNELRDKLAAAIEEQRFEDCIKIRDRISELEK